MLILSLSSSSSLYCTRCVCGYLCNEIGRCFFLFFLLSFFFLYLRVFFELVIEGWMWGWGGDGEGERRGEDKI